MQASPSQKQMYNYNSGGILPEAPSAKTKSFGGKRPRPEFISDSFGKNHNLFGKEFINVSTNPSKYNPRA